MANPSTLDAYGADNADLSGLDAPGVQSESNRQLS